MENQKPEETTAEPKETGLYAAARKVLLAAVGVTVVAQEEVENLVNKLAEKGEIAERDARRLMQEVSDKRDKMMEERRAEADRSRTAAATKSDVETLTMRVEELSRKIEEMKRKAS